MHTLEATPCSGPAPCPGADSVSQQFPGPLSSTVCGGLGYAGLRRAMLGYGAATVHGNPPSPAPRPRPVAGGPVAQWPCSPVARRGVVLAPPTPRDQSKGCEDPSPNFCPRPAGGGGSGGSGGIQTRHGRAADMAADGNRRSAVQSGGLRRGGRHSGRSKPPRHMLPVWRGKLNITTPGENL